MSRNAPLAALATLALTLTACGRSDQNPGFTPDQQAKLDGTAQGLDGVITLSDDIATAIGEVDPNGPPLQDQITTLDGRVSTLETEVADIQLRIQPDGEVATLDSDIQVPDPTAIGFAPAENVANVRDALRVHNQRLDAQTAQIGNLDAAIDARIQAAIDQLITDRIAPLEQAPRGFILGESVTTTTGAAGGLAGATALCAGDFVDEPTAHMCSLGEIQHAVATGQLNAANLNEVDTWTVPTMTAAYTQNVDYLGFHYDAAATSLTMSCNNLTEGLAPANNETARGSTVQIDLDFDGNGSNVYVVKPNVACDTALPVLCCR